MYKNAFIAVLNEPRNCPRVKRINTTAKVPPMTIANEGMLMNTPAAAPRAIVAIIRLQAAIKPSSVAKSTQLLPKTRNSSMKCRSTGSAFYLIA